MIAGTPERSPFRGFLAAALVLSALVRWLLMRSPSPYQAIFPAAWFEGPALGLLRVALNALVCSILLVVIPLAVVRLFAVRDGWWTDLLELLHLPSGESVRREALLLGIPLLGILAGWTAQLLFSSLCSVYPLAGRAPSLPWFWVALGETLYAVVLLSTEVFYRGVLLVAFRSVSRRYGLIWLALVCALDHVGAPWIELATSALGAYFLAWLAVRLRSLWPGAALHIAFALSVDVNCYLR